MRNKNHLLNKRKKAQHIVELSIIMPLFIMVFSFVFPILVNTYSNFHFVYKFANCVSAEIGSVNYFNSIQDYNNYNFMDNVKERLENVQGGDIFVSLIESKPSAYVIGNFRPERDFIYLFGIVGKNYFSYIVPINLSYIYPPVLNLPFASVQTAFEAYHDNEGF